MGWVSRFGSSVSGLGLGFWAFWGLGCLGGSVFGLGLSVLGLGGFRVLGLAQGFGFRA